MNGRLNSCWIAAAVLALACAGPPANDANRLEGRVTDDDGAQTRMFGGQGTAVAAASVRAQAVGNGGALELLAEVDVAADGTYQIDVPPNRGALVVEALDADGAVRGVAFVETSGAVGEATPVTPIDTESSLEALVLVELAALGAAPGELRVGDVRARLDVEVAVAVRAAVAAGADGSAIVRALAEASLAAQRTELEAYSQAGLSISVGALASAELAASQELSADLHTGSRVPRAAYDVFLGGLAADLEARGVDGEQDGRATACAEVAFRLTLEARLDGEASAGVLEAATLASARLEASVQARATTAILTTGEAASDVVQGAQVAGSGLTTGVGGSSTVDAAASAYAAYRAEVRGEGAASGSLLGNYFSIGVATESMVSGAIAASAAAALALDTALATAIATSAAAGGALDPATLAADVVAAFEVFFEVARTSTASLSTLHGELAAEVAASLLITADGSFRGGA